MLTVSCSVFGTWPLSSTGVGVVRISVVCVI